jgi:hypothetical protein
LPAICRNSSMSVMVWTCPSLSYFFLTI